MLRVLGVRRRLEGRCGTVGFGTPSKIMSIARQRQGTDRAQPVTGAGPLPSPPGAQPIGIYLARVACKGFPLLELRYSDQNSDDFGLIS